MFLLANINGNYIIWLVVGGWETVAKMTRKFLQADIIIIIIWFCPHSYFTRRSIVSGVVQCSAGEGMKVQQCNRQQQLGLVKKRTLLRITEDKLLKKTKE